MNPANHHQAQQEPRITVIEGCVETNSAVAFSLFQLEINIIDDEMI